MIETGSKTKSRTEPAWQKIRRYNRMSTALEIGREHKRSLDKEVERTSDLLMAYCYRLANEDTAKSDETRILRWAKRVPREYSHAIRIVSRLNLLLEEALERNPAN